LQRLPLPIRDGKLDLEGIASAARRVGEMEEQVGDIGAAIERVQHEKR
jgi:hypothetical protein